MISKIYIINTYCQSTPTIYALTYVLLRIKQNTTCDYSTNPRKGLDSFDVPTQFHKPDGILKFIPIPTIFLFSTSIS